ncbi:MAG: SusC/RagA family TonB-linked outer membrane protein [Bacteroidetes bacterium]|nr:SusC/RagA family TonB-linked outer membrane protein [Bacteroidota bacterium]
MKKYLLFLFLIFSIGLLDASAQSRTLSGKVIAQDGKRPIAGATVIVVGSNNGAITDNRGVFEIFNVDGAVKLDVSFIGFETTIIDVPASKTNVVIELGASALAMEDVIVTGYGNYSKKSFTGAAANIDMGEVADMPAISLESKLAGSVPGVTINTGQGGPGSVATIKIRGKGSINAGSSPLYVIDGIPMISGDYGSTNNGGGGSSVLATLNPNDIASTTVIKDAAAASLYGSRAANGVIVITTKQGKSGKAKINLKADWGFSDMAIDYRPQLNGPQRAQLLYQGEYNKNIANGKDEAYSVGKAEKLKNTYAAEPWSGWSDWKNLLFRQGFYQNYEASISGGSEKTRYYSSVSYTNQEGLTENQGYERYTGRLNLNSKKGRFTFNANALFSISEQKTDLTATKLYYYGSPIVHYATYSSPSQYPYLNLENKTLNHPDEPKGNLSKYSRWFPGGGNTNPIESRNLRDYRTSFNRTMLNGSVAFNILKGLDLKEVFAIDVLNERSYSWASPTGEEGDTINGSLYRYSSLNKQITSQTQLSYRNSFGNHNFDALVSYEIEDNPYEQIVAGGENYPSADLREIKNAAKTEGSWSTKNNDRMVSYVGKLDYNYGGRYYAGLSYRMDGSSRLAPDTRWGSFWSASGSWVASNEKFMDPIADVITLAKVRASYGVNGTRPWGYNGYMGLYTYGYKYAGDSGMSLSQVENSGLTWEKNYASNIGLDISLWNRLNVTLDLYNRDTKDLLIDKKVSNTSGFSTVLVNQGEMNNKGIELSVNGDIISTDELTWNLGFILAHNKNTLEKLDGVQNEIPSYFYTRRVGQPYYSFYMKEFADINPDDGEARYYSNEPIKDEKGKITGYERDLVDYDKAEQILLDDKPVDPKITGAINSVFAFKGIDFGFTFTFQAGAYVVDGSRQQFAPKNLYKFAVPIYYDYDKMWKNPGDVAEKAFFRTQGNDDEQSSLHLMNSDHIRLKNITLGYTLPKAWTNKISIERLRVYASASNLLTFKHKECVVDPEMYYMGTYETPSLRTVTFGLDFTF